MPALGSYKSFDPPDPIMNMCLAMVFLSFIGFAVNRRIMLTYTREAMFKAESKDKTVPSQGAEHAATDSFLWSDAAKRYRRARREPYLELKGLAVAVLSLLFRFVASLSSSVVDCSCLCRCGLIAIMLVRCCSAELADSGSGQGTPGGFCEFTDIHFCRFK